MATSPRQSAIGMATTINRYEPLVDWGVIPKSGFRFTEKIMI